MNKASVVVVLGMHRSGTSLITSVLEDIGLSVGNNLQPPGEDNPKGYWEDQEILYINNRLLLSLQLDWCSLKILEIEHIRQSPLFDWCCQRARTYLAAQIRPGNPFCFKDPRTAFLLPFWQYVFAQCGLEAYYVICKRDPHSIIDSLYERDGFCKAYSAQLLFIHWYQIARYTAGKVHSVVAYEALLSDEAAEKKRLCAELSLSTKGLRFKNKVEAELNHGKKEPSAIEIEHCLVWQQPFVASFPHWPSASDLISYTDELAPFLAALDQAYFADRYVKRLTDSIGQLAERLPQQLCVYGASETLALIIDKIRPKITLSVDKQAPFQKFGLTFDPIHQLEHYPALTILVTVVGRKAIIADALSAQYPNPILFIEDLLKSDA